MKSHILHVLKVLRYFNGVLWAMGVYKSLLRNQGYYRLLLLLLYSLNY